MTYAKITNNKIEKTGSRPRWFGDDGKPVTDELLRQHGWLPIRYVTPEYDPLLQYAAQAPRTEWEITEAEVIVNHTVHDIDIEQLRSQKLQAATDMRWDVLTGGMVLLSGARIGTSAEDRNNITSVVAVAELSGLSDEDTVDFKAQTGWVTLTVTEVKVIAGAVGKFVQACFTAERVHHEAIETLETREEISAYDVSEGWPS